MDRTEMWGDVAVKHFDARHIECVSCGHSACRLTLAEFVAVRTRSSPRRRGRRRMPGPEPTLLRGEKAYRCHYCRYVTITDPGRVRPRLKRSPNGVRRCELCRRVPTARLHKNGLCDGCNEYKQWRRRVNKCRRQRLRRRREQARPRIASA